MPAKRIDFKYVRDHANFEKVLGAYGIELQKDGAKPGQFKCLCPFHDDTKPSMKVNTDRNIYHCFACDAGGNVLEFVMNHDECDIRGAAKAVADISGSAYSANDTTATNQPDQASKKKAVKAKPQTSIKTEPEPEPEPDETEEVDGVPYNKVLSFELKNLITEHQFFDERGLTPAMIETFGLGIANRGMMKDRLVFPIHNAAGQLVAYCGRYVGDNPPEDEPKYKQPTNFRKDQELFNLHQVKADVGDKAQQCSLVLVESFFSVIKLHTWGYYAASPMGRSVSPTQIQLIKDAGFEEVILLFDGDDPGRAAVTTVSRQFLEAGFKVEAPVVAEDFKPHRKTEEQLGELLGH